MNPDLFKPNYYIEQSVTEYVCFNFPDDKYVSYSIILPRVGGDFNGVKRKIVGRMIKMSQKPEKWFFENNKILKGKIIIIIVLQKLMRILQWQILEKIVFI